MEFQQNPMIAGVLGRLSESGLTQDERLELLLSFVDVLPAMSVLERRDVMGCLHSLRLDGLFERRFSSLEKLCFSLVLIVLGDQLEVGKSLLIMEKNLRSFNAVVNDIESVLDAYEVFDRLDFRIVWRDDSGRGSVVFLKRVS